MNFGARYATVQIDITTWEALEEAGCIFVPRASYLSYSSTGIILGEEQLIGSRSNYWTATAHNAQQANRMLFDNRSMEIRGDARDGRCYAFPIRLAQDY